MLLFLRETSRLVLCLSRKGSTFPNSPTFKLSSNIVTSSVYMYLSDRTLCSTLVQCKTNLIRLSITASPVFAGPRTHHRHYNLNLAHSEELGLFRPSQANQQVKLLRSWLTQPIVRMMFGCTALPDEPPSSNYICILYQALRFASAPKDEYMRAATAIAAENSLAEGSRLFMPASSFRAIRIFWSLLSTTPLRLSRIYTMSSTCSSIRSSKLTGECILSPRSAGRHDMTFGVRGELQQVP